MSSTISVGSLDHYQLTPSEQLCYVHCHLCDTVLAVSVPSSSLYKTVTVRCGHCTSLLPVNMRGPIASPPPANSHLHLTNHHTFSPSPSSNLEVNMSPTPNMSPAQSLTGSFGNNYITSSSSSSSSSNRAVTTDLPKPSAINRPPEKRQRVPSAYNRFIKDEIQRIKAGNPDISHREAFSAAAKNWAHFPHIRFGLMPDQTSKRTTNIRTLPNPHPHPHRQEAGDDARMRNGYFGASARIGVSPY